eukprot:7389162-Prymnesium_polylepis.1
MGDDSLVDGPAVPVRDRAPADTGHHHHRFMSASTLGTRQVTSSRATAPSYSFGTLDRHGRTKVFLGGDYQLTSNFGETSPGPAHYETDAQSRSVGWQSKSGRSTAQSWRFGTEDRAGRGMSDDRRRPRTPGPGAYRTDVGAAGQQTSSKRPSSAQFGFGTASRATVGKTFISQQFASTATGDDNARSPGPACQANRRPQSAGFKYGFGSESRFQRAGASIGPGPGAYSREKQDTACGVQPASVRTSQPLYGFGSATRDDVARTFISDAMSLTANNAEKLVPGPGQARRAPHRTHVPVPGRHAPLHTSRRASSEVGAPHTHTAADAALSPLTELSIPRSIPRYTCAISARAF